MKAIEESGLIFEHDEKTCKCLKFDENIAYKKVDKMLKPTKGVDFIYIYDKEKIVFVEVKNFRGHTNDPASKKKFKADAEELMKAIAIKVRDSIACGMSSARFSTNDSKFWKLFSKAFLNEDKPVIVIAWLELDGFSDKEKKSLMATWNNKLKQKLHWIHSVRTSINDINNLPPIELNVRLKN